MYGDDWSERFWSKVDIREPNDCWEWKAGGLFSKRIFYGNFHYVTRDGKKGRCAHRASYELVNGSIPDGLMIRHKCDNGRCVNPAHLEVGTALDNARDCAERGRGGLGYRKEYCKRGHHIDGANAMRNGKYMRCRKCHRMKAMEHLERKKKIALTPQNECDTG